MVPVVPYHHPSPLGDGRTRPRAPFESAGSRDGMPGSAGSAAIPVSSTPHVRRTSDALRAAEVAYAVLLWRLKVGAFTLASSVVVVFFGVWLLAHYHWLPLTLGQRGLVKTVGALGSLASFPIAAMAILPTDPSAVRWVINFFCGGSLFLTCFFSAISVASIWARGRQGERTVAEWIDFGLWITQSMIGYEMHRCFTKSTAMAPRQGLLNLWQTGYHAGRLISTLWGVYGLAIFVLVDTPAERTIERALCLCLLCIGPRALVVIASQSRVGRVQLWLQRWKPLARERESPMSNEAGVGALLGRRGAEEALDRGQRHFRGIRFSRIDEDAFARLETARTLFSQSQLVELGGCDAFVCHSWHDDASLKWMALSEWAARFESLHGREPMLWIGPPPDPFPAHLLSLLTHFCPPPSHLYPRVAV